MRWLTAAIAAILVTASPICAQTADEPAEPSVKALPHELWDDVKALPSRDALIWSAIGAGAALAVHPLDNRATVELNRTQDGALHATFAPGRIIGETSVQVGLAAAVYAVGRGTHRERVEQIGIELIRAQLLTEGLVQGVKFAARRERPDASDNRSLPSGHAALTFATATVLERRFGWFRALPAYALAAYVATSRVTTDKHYLSDVVAGAFIGTIAARTVTRREGRLAHLFPIATPGGAAVLWTLAP